MRLPKIYVGTHNPAHARWLPRCMISANRLERRRKPIDSPDWIMDSGAFTRIQSGRGHMAAPDYVEIADRLWNPGLAAVVSQDWMCEPHILAETGLSVARHQEMTTARFHTLRLLMPEHVPLMPVIQGWEPADYARHARQMAPWLSEDAWVGVGSVCRRNADPEAVYAVLDSILDACPDWALHGFGVKSTSLADPRVADRLYSVDSMAWSFAARREGRGYDANRWEEALDWLERVEVQVCSREEARSLADAPA